MLRVLLVALLLPVVASAQTFAPQAPITLDILAGYEPVAKIQASPTRPGDDVLYRNKVWRHVVLVVVPAHPTKHGPNGQYAGPGVCLESAQAFAIFDPVITIADLTGDGIDDAVGTAGGQTQVLTGLGVSACR